MTMPGQCGRLCCSCGSEGGLQEDMWVPFNIRLLGVNNMVPLQRGVEEVLVDLGQFIELWQSQAAVRARLDVTHTRP